MLSYKGSSESPERFLKFKKDELYHENALTYRASIVCENGSVICFENSLEKIYVYGLISSPTLELIDSDSSSLSSSTDSRDNAPGNSRSTSLDGDSCEYFPLQRSQADVEPAASLKYCTYKRSSTEPTPSALLTHQEYLGTNVDPNAAEDGVMLSEKITAEKEPTAWRQHENLDSEVMPNISDHLTLEISSPSRGSHQVPSSSSGRGDDHSSGRGDDHSSGGDDDLSTGSDNDPSTEDGSSSESHTSKVSDAATQKASSDNNPNTLEGVLNDVLRTDPEVAQLLYRLLDGKLECAPCASDHSLDTDSSLSMLNLLTIQDPRPIQHQGAFTYAPSSSSGSSGSSYHSSSKTSPAGARGSSSSSGSNGGNALGSSNNISGRDAADNGGISQLTKQLKGKPKSNTSPSSNIHSLRCFYNVFLPETFCVNHETRERFRACGGPGWNTFQHLKDHMTSHHTKKPDALKCSDCQKDFKNLEALTNHKTNVDCSICCPYCDETFLMKTMRATHLTEKHPEGGRPSGLMELDDAMWEKIKENLKAFIESSRKGKGQRDPNITEWIERNTPRYMIGRRAGDANPTLELGQWYIMCKTLSQQEHVPEHPFYDYISAKDLASERIMLIYDSTLNSTIQFRGHPPSELQSQIAWYKSILSTTLQIAGRTRLKMDGKPQISEISEITDESLVATSFPSGPSSGYVQQACDPHNTVPLPEIPGHSQSMMQDNAAITHQSQPTMMNQQLLGMDHPSMNLLLEHQRQIGAIASLPNTENSTSNGTDGDRNGIQFVQQFGDQLEVEHTFPAEYLQLDMTNFDPHERPPAKRKRVISI